MRYTLDEVLKSLEIDSKEKRTLKIIRNDGKYGEEFYQEFRDVKEISNSTQLAKKISKSSFIYFGDYHSVLECQLEIAKRIEKIVRNYPAIIYLEIFDKKNQPNLDKYLENKISTALLFNKIRFKSKWGVESKGYKAIVEKAREYDTRVIGVYTTGKIDQRDEKISNIIKKNYFFRKNFKHIVIIGQHHLARMHLVSKVCRKTNNYNYTIILQNLEHLYEKVKIFLDKSKIIRLDEDAFCIFNLPPIKIAEADLKYFKKINY